MTPSAEAVKEWIGFRAVGELSIISTEASVEAEVQRRRERYFELITEGFAAPLWQDLTRLAQRAQRAGLIGVENQLEWVGFGLDFEQVGDSGQTREPVINPVVRVRRNSQKGNGEQYLVIGQGESRVAQELVEPDQYQNRDLAPRYRISGLVEYVTVGSSDWFGHVHQPDTQTRNYITIVAGGEGIGLDEKDWANFRTRLTTFLGQDKTAGASETLRLDDASILARARDEGKKWLEALRRGGMATTEQVVANQAEN